MATPVVELQHVCKYFANVIANHDVSFSVGEGEVVALLGENGAGKSTIMKILYGLYGADEGDVFIRGEKVHIKSPKDAMGRGIAMIQQHFSLVPTHTVTENIILGNVHGVISMEACGKKVKEIAQTYGFDIPVDAKVGDLSVGQQQKVEILKALYLDAKILIMDEPTAVLTPQESTALMGFIRDFAANGHSVVFITHKMKEVMEAADRIVIMRNGVVAGNVAKADTNEHDLAQMMIGQDLSATATLEPVPADAPVALALDKVSVAKKGQVPILSEVSLQVRQGEVFGIAGVSGNGQDEVCEVICGGRAPTSGAVHCAGQDITNMPLRQRIELGIGYVPVDRYRDAMVMDMTLWENLLLKSSFSKQWTRHGFLSHKKLRAYTKDMIANHQVKASGPEDRAGSLSGGNQQKLVLGREIDVGTQVIVFNQPTRGLDMGAVDRIHQSILEEKKAGKGILLVSTELSEIFEMCDRYAIMHQGHIVGIYENGQLTTQQVGLLMAGSSLEGAQDHEI